MKARGISAATPAVTRRALLRSAGLAAAGMAVGARSRGDLAGADATLGIAVVGLGSFASFALPRIATSRRARVAALVSGDRAKAERVAADHGIELRHLYDYETFDRIADDPSIDVVYLTLPVGLHAGMAIRALQAGKHVLVEKTLAATSAQAREMIAAAEMHERHLMVAYRAYFGPAYEAVHRLVREGGHGRVVHIDAHKGFAITLPAGNWRFDPALGGGGSLIDIGVYSVQAARLFAGAMPVRVTAQKHSPPDPRFRTAEADIVFTMEFPGGALASGSASWSYRLQNRLRVGLERAWVDLEPASPVIGQVLRIASGQGHQAVEQPLEQVDQLPLMFDHVADVVLDGVPPAIPATEGLRDLQIIEAIYAAAASGAATAVEAAPVLSPAPERASGRR